MILCCAHCGGPIPRPWDDDMFCSDQCGDAFSAEIAADAEGSDW
jgi:predicted nucleic acid-binding Zn ribbon protein